MKAFRRTYRHDGYTLIPPTTPPLCPKLSPPAALTLNRLTNLPRSLVASLTSTRASSTKHWPSTVPTDPTCLSYLDIPLLTPHPDCPRPRSPHPAHIHTWSCLPHRLPRRLACSPRLPRPLTICLTGRIPPRFVSPLEPTMLTHPARGTAHLRPRNSPPIDHPTLAIPAYPTPPSYPPCPSPPHQPNLCTRSQCGQRSLLRLTPHTVAHHACRWACSALPVTFTRAPAAPLMSLPPRPTSNLFADGHPTRPRHSYAPRPLTFTAQPPGYDDRRAVQGDSH